MRNKGLISAKKTSVFSYVIFINFDYATVSTIFKVFIIWITILTIFDTTVTLYLSIAVCNSYTQLTDYTFVTCFSSILY